MFALTSSKKFPLVAICAAVLALAPALAFTQQDDDPPPQAGRLSYISGNVSIQPAMSDQWGQAYPNLPVGPGDRIFTDSDGRAEIQLGQTYVRVGPNTDVTLVDASQFDINFGVAQGSIRLHSFGLWPRQLLDVSTPNGNAEFGEQGDLRVDVMPNDGATVFTNLGQFADITAAGDYRQELDYGQSLEVAGTNPVYPQWLQPAGPDDLDYWSQERDQRLMQVASYQYVSPDVPGAADLDANGDWQPETEYGAMWFPRNVPADWEPYHYGHWINRDPWGWVWVEDESWGYAPFHYGRWVSYHGRWGWIPGPVNVRPVWSPALVVFAGGINVGGGGLSVWFPLGPGEPYRPWYRCSPRYINAVNITNIREAPRVRVERSYVNIVNITNITYVNRTYVTAVHRDDFASGRSVRNVAVRVDPREFQHIRPLDRPDVAPPSRPIVTRPIAHPVRVSDHRPMLINQQGRQIAAAPHATPVAPPVRPVTQPRQIPGRTAIAAPTHVTAPGRPGQFPTMQGNRQQQPNQQNPSFPDRGVPRANPVHPVQGIHQPLTPAPGNQQPNQYGNPNERQQGRPPVVTGRPMTPPPNVQQPERPNYQQQRPNQQENPQQRPNQPGNPYDRQGQPPFVNGRPMPPPSNVQRPEQPNYPQQRPNQPGNPYERQQGQPPAVNGRPMPPPSNVQQPERPNYPQQRPEQPNYQQQRPNQPGNPSDRQQNRYRQDFGPVQPNKHVDEAPRPPQNNVQPYRPAPPAVQQGRPAPPPEPNRSFDRPNNRQESRPQQEARPRDEGQKQNKDQKQDNKKDEKKHN